MDSEPLPPPAGPPTGRGSGVPRRRFWGLPGIVGPADLAAFRKDPRLLAQHLLERIQRARTPVPLGGRIVHATFEVTFVCNLRCPFCTQWGAHGVGFKMLRGEIDSARIRRELKPTQWHRIVDQLVPHQTTINLTGGEVFTRSHTMDLIEHISGRGLDLTVTTNGTACGDEEIRRMAATEHLRSVNISIDGDREFHDAGRGAGNFDRSLRTATLLAEARRNRPAGWPALEIRTNSVLLPGTHRSLVDLAGKLQAAGIDRMNVTPIRLCTKERADLHFAQLKEDLGVEDRGVYGEVHEPLPDDFPAQASVSLERLREAFPTFANISPVLAPKNIARYHTDLDWTYRPDCTQMYRALRVRADGKVIFCPDQWIANTFIGDLAEQTVAEVWNGPAARAFRIAIDRRGSYPGCVRCCITNRDDS